MIVEHAVTIALGDIQVPAGRRGLDEAKVRELAASIAALGVLVPILVTREGRLVAGLHRVTACRSLGLARVPCEYVEADALHLELAEIDENFMRADLDAIEKGEAFVRRDEILTALGLRSPAHAPTGNQNAAKNKGATVAPLFSPAESESAPVAPVASPPPPKTTAQIAKEAGMSTRSVQVHKQIARNIIPPVREALKGLPIGNSTRTLLALSRQPAEVQQRYADAVTRGDTATTDEIARTYAPNLAPPIHGQPHITQLTISADVKQAAATIWEHFPMAWSGDLVRLLSERLAARKGT